VKESEYVHRTESERTGYNKRGRKSEETKRYQKSSGEGKDAISIKEAFRSMS
jgi:hypothetical protein